MKNKTNAFQVNADPRLLSLIAMIEHFDNQMEIITSESGQTRSEVLEYISGRSDSAVLIERMRLSTEIWHEVNRLKSIGISQKSAATMVGRPESDISTAKNINAPASFSIQRMLAILNELKKI